MLFLFRTRQPLFNFFLLWYAALLQLRTFFLPAPEPVRPQGLFADLLLSGITQQPALAFSLQVLLLFMGGLLINDLINKSRITGEYNLFPGLFFILVASFLPEFVQFSALYIILIFMLLVARQVFAIYRVNKASDYLVNIGLLIGVASLFYFSATIFLIWAMFGINSMRSLTVKEAIGLVIGFLIPYIFAGTWFFWNDNFGYFVEHQFELAAGFPNWSATVYPAFSLKMGWMAFWVLGALASYPYFSLKKTHAESKKIDLIYGFMLVAGLSVFVQAHPGLQHLLLLSLPLGIVLAFIFGTLRPRWGEFLHLLLLVVALLFQYRLFLFPG